MVEDINDDLALFDNAWNIIKLLYLFRLFLEGMQIWDVRRFLQDAEDFNFPIFWLLQLSLKIFQSHHLLCFFLVEVENDEIVQLSFFVVFDEKLSFLESSKYLFFVDLSVEDCPISDDGLYDQNLNLRSIFDVFLFIFLNGHIERHLLCEKILFDKKTCGWQRLVVVSVLNQSIHDIWLDNSVTIKNEFFSFLFLQIIVVVTFSAISYPTQTAMDIQQACLWDGEKFMTFLAD